MFESLKDLELLTFHRYNVEIPFTVESWMGRIRACRGVGAFLSKERVIDFDKEHYELLYRITRNDFFVLHEIAIHIFKI
jgi:hypothetical protein